MTRAWTKVEVQKVEDELLALGPDRTTRIWCKASLPKNIATSQPHAAHSSLLRSSIGYCNHKIA